MTVNCTTLARVRDRLKKTNVADTSDDTLLQEMIDGVSREIERHLGYELEQKSRVERYSPEVGNHLVFLRQRPVVSITQVRVASEGTWDFAIYTTLVANKDYRLVGNNLYFVAGLIFGRDTLEVTYVAGVGTTDAAVITAAPEIALAADTQIVEDFKRRDSQGASGKGGKTYVGEIELLKRTRQLLAGRRRMVFA